MTHAFTHHAKASGRAHACASLRIATMGGLRGGGIDHAVPQVPK